MPEVPQATVSEIPELYRVLTSMLILPEGITWRERNAIFFARLRETRAYSRNQGFKALVDHLAHYHQQLLDERSI